MIQWDLCKIDWTAIGSIITFLAFIFTWISLYISNKQYKKNRELQFSILRQEKAQKQLHDFLENILQMVYEINPLNVLNYSEKLRNGVFTDEDKKTLEDLARKDELNYTQLGILYATLDKFSTAKPLIDSLHKLREYYGAWSRIINPLFLFFSNIKSYPTDFIAKQIQFYLNEMIQTLNKINHPYKKEIKEIIESSNNDIDKLFDTLSIFESVISSTISEIKKEFSNQVHFFAIEEQKRINDLVK